MMKKIWLLLLALTFLLPSIPTEVSANSSGEIEETEKIEEHLGVDKPQMRFEIKFPNDAESVLTTGYSFSGKGKIVYFAPSQKDRTIYIDIAGEEVVTESKVVYGFSNSRKEKFVSTPGNAMCRYSDGIDWQISSVKTTDFSQTKKRYSNTTTAPPTDIPYGQITEIATYGEPKLSLTGTSWFDGTGKDAKSIPISQIDPNSLELPKGAAESVLGSAIYPNDYDPKNPKVGTQYKPKSREFKLLTTIPTSNPAFLTGHAICKMYPSPINYYITAKTIPTKVYNYSGTVTFKYKRPDGAIITAKLVADPNSVKFEGNDILVKATIEAEVSQLQDPGALEYYMFYVRTEDGTQNPDGIKVAANRQLKASAEFTFKIPKSKMDKVQEYTEIFVGRARGCYKPSSYYVDPKNGSCMDSGQVFASTYVYKEEPEKPDPETKDQKKPVAIITADSEVKRGDDVFLDGSASYDPDGEIVGYRWVMNGAQEQLPNEYAMEYMDTWTWYDTLGPKKILLYVKDNDGLQAGTTHSLVVVEPTIDAWITQTGTLKENRKVTFSESSDTPTRYPVDQSKTKWTVESLYGDLDNQIRYEGTLNGKKSFDVLFKKAGEYKVTLEVTNTAGYTDTATKVVTIKPDEAPYTDFTFQQKIFRDPVKGNQATFELEDNSYSFDGDIIVSRKWYVIFDANNDGIFNETPVLFNNANQSKVTYSSTHVGNYQFRLEVQEEFGQPTIEKFVTAADRRKTNTWQ